VAQSFRLALGSDGGGMEFGGERRMTVLYDLWFNS